MQNDRRALLILTFLMLAISLPFVRRAYFVDDFYFVTMAKGILEHPARPYDFISDDAGIANIAWERGKQPRMVNPPLFHYFLAAVIKGWGEESWKLRTASLIFSLISLYAMYFLGKRFVRDSLAAASLLAITPAFWLTSYSLLIDSALMGFFMAALAVFIKGQEEKRMGLLILSGVLMAATLLTKYTGFLILPVVLLWHLLNRERCSWVGTLAATGVCAVLVFLWGVWGIMTYGEMHFLATFSRGFHKAAPVGMISLGLLIGGLIVRLKLGSTRVGLIVAWGCWIVALVLMGRVLSTSPSIVEWLQTFYLDKLIAVASFFGGTTVFLFFAPKFLWQRNKSAVAVIAMAMGLLYLCFASQFGGFDRVQSFTLVFFIGSTLAFLWCIGPETFLSKDKPDVSFLSLWLAIGLLELVLVMPWTAARYLLILLPPACWLFRRLAEKTGRIKTWWGAWGLTAVMGAALAYVDFAQAGVIVPLSKVLENEQARFQTLAPRPKNHWFYLADTFDGSQPYVLRLGWENVFPFQQFPRGSLFLRSRYRKSSWWEISHPERFQPVAAWEFDSWIPLRVMDVPASAGFYASCWGSLPYAITRHPLERFELYIVR